MRLSSFAATLALLVCPLHSHAAWHVASSDHFIIYANQDPEELRNFSVKLEKFQSALTVAFAVPDAVPSPSNRVTIYVVKNRREVMKLYGDGSTMANISAFYVPKAPGATAIIPPVKASRTGRTSDSERLLLHEYTHHFLAENFPFLIPHWYSEGSAEYFSATRFNADGSLGIGFPDATVTRNLERTKWVALPELLDSKAFFAARNSRDFRIYYDQSWLLLHYLYSTNEGRKSVIDYIIRLNLGTAELEAAQGAFGDIDVLAAKLDAYHERNQFFYWLAPLDNAGIGSIDVRELTDAETAILPVVIRSDLGINQPMANDLVQQARDIAKDYPDDPAVLTALAEVEFAAGNTAEAIIAADKALAANPTNINALLKKGAAVMANAMNSGDATIWTSARQLFVQANQIENDHPMPLVHYYQSFLNQNLAPSSTAVAGLERAMELAPYDPSIRMLAAQQQMNERRFFDVIRTISPLAYNPHAERNNPAMLMLDTALQELAP